MIDTVRLKNSSNLYKILHLREIAKEGRSEKIRILITTSHLLPLYQLTVIQVA